MKQARTHARTHARSGERKQGMWESGDGRETGAMKEGKKHKNGGAVLMSTPPDQWGGGEQSIYCSWVNRLVLVDRLHQSILFYFLVGANWSSVDGYLSWVIYSIGHFWFWFLETWFYGEQNVQSSKDRTRLLDWTECFIYCYIVNVYLFMQNI